MKQVASLHYGVIFKKAFSDPFVFKGFVRDILGIHIEIDTVETEKSFSQPIGKVNTRFDLFAEDKKNRIIVDIQHERLPDHYDRFLHYHCVALIEQAAKASRYHPNLQVFTIVVLTSGDRYKTDISIIEFDPRNLQGEKLGIIPHKIVYLCPKYVSENTPNPYREWLLAINDSLDEQVEENQYQLPEINQILSVIAKDLLSNDERTRMMDEHARELARQEAIREEVEKIALSMFEEGFDLTLILKLTGLTETDLRQLTNIT